MRSSDVGGKPHVKRRSGTKFPLDLIMVAELVKKFIADNTVMVFSKSYCPYCIRAKKLFTSLNIQFTAIELDQRNDGNAIQSYLAEMTGQRTVPNIFIKGKHVGGCDDVHALHAKGKLLPMLQ